MNPNNSQTTQTTQTNQTNLPPLPLVNTQDIEHDNEQDREPSPQNKPNPKKYLNWVMVEDERIAAPINPFDPLENEDDSLPMDDIDKAACLKKFSDFAQFPADHYLSLRLQLETLTSLSYGETIETGTLKGEPAFPLGIIKASYRALELLYNAHCPLLKLLLRHLGKRWGAITEQEEEANFDALRLGHRIQSKYYLQPYDQDEYAATVERTPIKITTAGDRSTTTILLAVEADLLDLGHKGHTEAQTQLLQTYQARYPGATLAIEAIADYEFETYPHYILTDSEREESVKYPTPLRVRPEDIIVSKAVLKLFKPSNGLLLTGLLKHLSGDPGDHVEPKPDSSTTQRYLISSFTLPTDEETTQSVNLKMITDDHPQWPCTLIVLAEECQGQAMG